MTINWEEAQANYGSQFKEFAPDGVHAVKIEKVENRASTTSETIWMEFYPEQNDQYKFPKISHPLSNKNLNWRAWHWKELFVLFGATEENAKKAVETCENKKSYKEIAAAYEQAMNRIATKAKPVDIEVWREPNSVGKVYAVADFNTGVRLNRPEDTPTAPTTTTTDDIDLFADTEPAEDITEDELPF